METRLASELGKKKAARTSRAAAGRFGAKEGSTAAASGVSSHLGRPLARSDEPRAAFHFPQSSLPTNENETELIWICRRRHFGLHLDPASASSINLRIVPSRSDLFSLSRSLPISNQAQAQAAADPIHGGGQVHRQRRAHQEARRGHRPQALQGRQRIHQMVPIVPSFPCCSSFLYLICGA